MFTNADSFVPLISRSDKTQTIKIAGKLIIPPSDGAPARQSTQPLFPATPAPAAATVPAATAAAALRPAALAALPRPAGRERVVLDPPQPSGRIRRRQAAGALCRR